jgi:hypothetical protein
MSVGRTGSLPSLGIREGQPPRPKDITAKCLSVSASWWRALQGSRTKHLLTRASPFLSPCHPCGTKDQALSCGSAGVWAGVDSGRHQGFLPSGRLGRPWAGAELGDSGGGTSACVGVTGRCREAGQGGPRGAWHLRPEGRWSPWCPGAC